MSRKPPVTEPEAVEKTVVVNREYFQALHNAARAVYANMLSIESPSLEIQIALTLLDNAVSHGHEVLGTDRGFADQYIEMAGGVTKHQMKNMKAFLAREGIDADNIRHFPQNRS